MNRLNLLAAALLLFSAASARAFIGETPQQLDARYGRPVEITIYRLPKFQGQVRKYVGREITIIATFMGGTSHREIYVKDRPWSDAEIQHYTRANSSKFGIQVHSTSPTRVTWSFGDNLYATYNTRRRGTSFLTVSTAWLARAESIPTREQWFWRY